jgi:HK97 family phage portal protein
MAGSPLSVFGRLMDRLAGRKTEQRRGGSFGDFGTGPSTLVSGLGYAGVRMAENLSVVTACVELISGTIASLPCYVFEKLPNGRQEALDHPVSQLLLRPNLRQSWPDWLGMTMGQVLLWGNALSIVERDEAGNPIALIPIPWQNVNVTLLNSGRLRFDVLAMTMPWGGSGSMRHLFDDEVFLLKGRSEDSYLGRSVLARAPSVLRAAQGAQLFATSLWENMAAPSASLSHPSKLNAEAKTYLREQFRERHQGARHAGSVVVLDEGMKLTPISATAEDSELTDARRYSGEELCRLFNVPPQLIGENQFGSFSNVETAGRFFATFCLAPWARRIEAEFQRSVFVPGDDHHLMVDLSGLQRGDDQARWSSYAIARQYEILSVNEIRAQEGWNPVATPVEPIPGAEEP